MANPNLVQESLKRLMGSLLEEEAKSRNGHSTALGYCTHCNFFFEVFHRKTCNVPNSGINVLRGTNITLQRFFEDPESDNLAWNHEWVKKMLIDIPKTMDWNAKRICVGIVPDFWYEIADENGLLFQNEWLYWQNHGWNEQIKNEFTDWVWTDGSHPSICIWDGINENHDEYIGNTLIPELKHLDSTRIWGCRLHDFSLHEK